MEEVTNDAIVNRDDPIPVIKVPTEHDDDFTTSTSDTESRRSTRDRIKEQASKVKDTLSDYGNSEVRQSLQERFLNSVMSQILPAEDLQGIEDEGDSKDPSTQKKKDRRSRTYVERPNFSIPLMSSNFRRFNARVGVLFVLQNRLIHLFTWRHPTATLSFLAIYSLLCLQPHLLPLVPLIALLTTIMIPSFLARHPIPTNDPRMEPSYSGPPLAPPSRVKPVPEMSKDFFRNMRDLQNSMEDFSRLHDTANDYITPYTNFSSEGLSTLLFVSVTGTICLALLASPLIPWRFIALIAGWTTTLSTHPSAQTLLLTSTNLAHLRTHLTALQTRFKQTIETDIILNDPAPERQVEIFELQHYHPSITWEPWLFSPTPYDPFSPARVAGSRARGTQFFENVQPPAGWRWRGKKWNLDMASREWVESRMVTGVEVEMEGGRWVYDLADGVGGKGGWEEGGGGEGKRGEWRRRRWVRSVERRVERES